MANSFNAHGNQSKQQPIRRHSNVIKEPQILRTQQLKLTTFKALRRHKQGTNPVFGVTTMPLCILYLHIKTRLHLNSTLTQEKKLQAIAEFISYSQQNENRISSQCCFVWFTSHLSFVAISSENGPMLKMFTFPPVVTLSIQLTRPVSFLICCSLMSIKVTHLSQNFLLCCVWQQIASYWSAVHTIKMM